jgi:hypothetical protein
MKSFYLKFSTKAVLDAAIAENPAEYIVGTFSVDLATGKVYVSNGTAWELVGAQS